MQIVWHGNTFFEVLTSNDENQKVKIVIDPPFFDKKENKKLKKVLNCDILLFTQEFGNENNINFSQKDCFLISGPGEYEVKGIFFQGILSFCDGNEKKTKLNTIYTIESENLKVCHLGKLGQEELNEEQLEKIGQIDILMVPIGGDFTISTKKPTKIISQIEPKIVIPMAYQVLQKKSKQLEEFLKNLGVKDISPKEKLNIKKKDLAENKTEVVLLKP